MADRITAPSLLTMKQEGRRIVCATAYDAAEAALAEEAGIDVVLVGDSVANVKLGLPNTVFATLPMMIHHTEAAARSVHRALLLGDLPFGSYQSSVSQAVDSASALMQAGARAVKLEGFYPDRVEALVRAGIPTFGHLGMTPQSVNAFGGHKVQGRTEEGHKRLMREALELQEAGMCAVVLELIPGALAAEITASLAVPTIGIGAGPSCDGEVQVWADLLGLSTRVYKHAKPYMNGREQILGALRSYAADVRGGSFPGPEQTI